MINNSSNWSTLDPQLSPEEDETMINYSSNWPTLDPQLSPEEEAQLLSIRSEAVKRYKILAISMTVVSIFSIIIGIVIVSSSSGIGFPLSSGSPIWSGVIVLIGAVFGIWLGHTDPEWKTESDKSKQRCLVIVFYVFAVTSMSFCGLCIGYSAWGAAACGGENSETCGDNFQVEVAMNIIAALTGVILIICCAVVTGMFCYYRKAFKFYNRRDRFVQMQMLILQQQQQLAAQNRGQPVQTTHPPFTQIYSGPQTGYSNTQTGYLNTHTNVDTNWSTLPPSYSDVVYSSTKY